MAITGVSYKSLTPDIVPVSVSFSRFLSSGSFPCCPGPKPGYLKKKKARIPKPCTAELRAHSREAPAAISVSEQAQAAHKGIVRGFKGDSKGVIGGPYKGYVEITPKKHPSQELVDDLTCQAGGGCSVITGCFTESRLEYPHNKLDENRYNGTSFQWPVSFGFLDFFI